MAIPAYICFLILPAIFLFAIILGYSWKTSELPWNWPLVGMLAALLANFHRLRDYPAELLDRSGGTFIFKGPWFINLDFIITGDPENVHHVISSNIAMYAKPAGSKKRYDIFGSSLFILDFDEWKNQKALAKGFLSHQRLHQLMPKFFEDSMNKKMIPSLEHFSEQQLPVDFARLIQAHLFYISCRVATGCDANSFPVSLHEGLLPNAISDACEAILARHVFPESFWKLQKWLGVGKERKLSDAWVTINTLLNEQISLKRKEMKDVKEDDKEDVDFNYLKLQLNRHKLDGTESVAENYIKDNILALIFASQDTTSTALTWFFWLLSKHPDVEKKIREEIQEYYQPNVGEMKWLPYGAKELNKMVYLHGALCETLRLYPPFPFHARSPVKDDTLPSGHRIDQGQNILICTYAMGRMTSIWGEDCREFKPERWITHDGGIKHEPLHKFFAFSAGPRVCMGKDMAFALMKATASAIIHNYHIQVIENHPIKPKNSIIMHMKHGLMVTVNKRWT